MKGKIVRGSGFRGCLDYIIDPTKKAYIVGGNMSGRNAQDLAREFGYVRRVRTGCKKPVLHIALRMPAGEDVDDAKWLSISLNLLTMMKLSNRPWLLVKHVGEHVHLVTSRIDNNGAIWTGKWEALKLIAATQELERKFGLTITPGLSGQNHKQTRLTSGQLRKVKREIDRGEQVIVPAKVAIAERIQKAVAQSDGTIEDFQVKLENLGVKLQLNKAKSTDHVSGISYSFEGLSIKGSKVARAFSWQGLTRLLAERRIEYENQRNPRTSPRNDPSTDVRRADQSVADRIDAEPVGSGDKLGNPSNVDSAVESVLDGADGGACDGLELVGAAVVAIGGGEDLLGAVAKTATGAKRERLEDCEMAVIETGNPMTLS